MLITRNRTQKRETMLTVRATNKNGIQDGARKRERRERQQRDDDVVSSEGDNGSNSEKGEHQIVADSAVTLKSGVRSRLHRNIVPVALL